LKRVAIGSAPARKRCTNASLTTATRGDVDVSRSSNVRPRTTRVPSVSKNPADTRFNIADRWLSGGRSNPSASIVNAQQHSSNGLQDETAGRLTPGTAFRRAYSWRYNGPSRLKSYPARAGLTSTTSTRSVSKPYGWVARFASVRASAPAVASTTSDNAT